MTRQEIEKSVTKVILRYVPEWNGELDRWDASALDSLEYIELVFELADEFGIEVPLDLEDVQTPKQLVDHIEKELASEDRA